MESPVSAPAASAISRSFSSRIECLPSSNFYSLLSPVNSLLPFDSYKLRTFPDLSSSISLEIPFFRNCGMGTLQGLVICPMDCRTQHRLFPSTRVLNRTTIRQKNLRNIRLKSNWINLQSHRTVRLCLNSPVDGNSTGDEDFGESNSDYINSSVIEAVEVASGPDGFVIRMRDGKNLRCIHNNPQTGGLSDYAPHPAIVLKMEDGTGFLLPIIVLETPSVLLMAALCNVPSARPTMYQVIKEILDQMGYLVKFVRITKRVQEAYFAELFLAKVMDMDKCMSFDLRPSDAINIAIRCKAPIQVNKYLVCSDGMRIVEAIAPRENDKEMNSLDRPCGGECVEAVEFDLVRNMLIAAVEERYRDAALYRDKLTQLRARMKWT